MSISFAEAVNNLQAFLTVMSSNERRDCFDKIPVVERNSSVEPLSPLICERCGGTIDRQSMICPYCDTECEKYLDYKRSMEEYYNAMNEERKYNCYVSQRLDRLSKIARRNK